MDIKLFMIILVLSFHSYSKERQFAVREQKESNVIGRQKRQQGECGSIIELMDCNMEETLTFSRREENRFRVKYIPGKKCKIIRYLFDWTLLLGNDTNLEFSDYYNRDVFLIKPYTIGSGEHSINVFIREYYEGGDSNFIGSDYCMFEMRPELPIVQITGGSEITARSDEDLFISGKESIDVNVAPGLPGNLIFSWTCTVTGAESEICDKKLGSGSSITIPRRWAKDNAIYTVTLSVKTPETDWHRATQVVHFKNDAVVVKIMCLKNCPPVAQKTNSKERVILKVACEKYCTGLNKDMYGWSIDLEGFNYDSNTKNGRNTDVFNINENALKAGNKYNVKVALKDKPGGSTIMIDVHTPPKLDSCSVAPTSGEALQTEFTAKCQYGAGEYAFEIYSTKDNIDVIIEKGARLQDLPFTLGAGSKVKIKIMDNFRFSDEKLIDVNVISTLPTTGSDKDIENEIIMKYFNTESEYSLSKLMNAKDFEKALKVISIIADDLKNVLDSGKSEIARKYIAAILEFLQKIPMNSSTRMRQLGSLAAKISDIFRLEPDPKTAALTTEVCKNSAEKMLKGLKTKRFPQSFAEETRDSVSTLSRCSQTGLTSNMKILEPEILAPEITTQFPLLDLPTFTEDYPDYFNDQNISKAMNYFDKAATNMIKTCFVNSKNLAIEISTEEDTAFHSFSDFNLTSTLKTGHDLMKTLIHSQGVTLVPSADFGGTKSAVHVAMCTSTQNIFWWMQKQDIITSIAILEFNIKEIPITEFKKPFSLSFEINSEALSKIKVHSYRTSRISSASVPRAEQEFENMYLIRIDAYSQQSFVIEFQNLLENTVLDVIVTHFYKPSFQEFKRKSIRIDKANYKLFIANREQYDSWYYLTVLPNSKMVESSVDHQVQISTSSCIRWSEREVEWKFACASNNESTKLHVHCNCYRSSVFAGRIVNNEIREESTFIEELQLELQSSYIIISAVAITFFLYCIFFIWFSVGSVDEARMIYFLSDVPSAHRYGYVLIVKTGNKANAGTTSNVTMKIYGTKSDSKEHVINYPDPDKKLLQRNSEDWFLVGTDVHCGDIEKIDIWFDSIGYRPSWYCSEVVVFDVKQKKHWTFQVNKWFEILRDEHVVYTSYAVEPGDTKTKKNISRRILRTFLMSFRGPHLWNLLDKQVHVITRMKRLHIIFSLSLTTYLFAMFLYGCPKLENSDSLAYTLDYRIDLYAVFATIACPILAFAVHFPVIWFFRYPKKNILGKRQIFLKQYSIDTSLLCWLFLFTNIFLSMTALIILGFWVPHFVGLIWLTSVLLSFLAHIFIMENVMRLIINFTIDQHERVENIFTTIKSSLDTVEKQRSMLYKQFGDDILRPFFHHLYKPHDEHKIKELKYWAELRKNLWEIVEDLVMIIIYVTLLYLVILMDRDDMTYLSNTEVEHLVTGTYSRTDSLDEALHRKELQDYIKDTVIFSMQSLQWYAKYITKNPGMTVDNANKYLGVARLRQHRTQRTPCRVDVIDRPWCSPPYHWSSESRDFSESWGPDNLSNRFARLDAVWDYTSEWKDGTLSYVGQFAHYPGGGYMAALGRTMQNSIVNFDYLIRNGWIDALSRCIFVEFLLYNPSINLFNSVRINFEISATGYITQGLDVHTAKLLFVQEETNMMIWIIFLSFLAMILILILKIISRLVRNRNLILKDLWHFVDITIILMNLVCLGFYAARSEVVRLFLMRVEKAKNNEFVNYFHLMYTESILTSAAAVLVFIATLRLWKLMRFMVSVKVVEKTLLLSAAPLLCLFLYQLVFVLACAFSCLLKYGDYADDFRDTPNSIFNLFLISMGMYDGFDFDVLSGGIGYFYYSMFNLIMLSIYTWYIAIITISYANASLYYSDKEEYNVVSYAKEQYNYYKELIKIRWRNIRLRGGREKYPLDKKVHPKPDEFRYAKCVTMSTNNMKAMIFVTRCLLRNTRSGKKLGISDKDADLIKYTIVSLFRPPTEDKEIFFISNVAGQKVKFVDDEIMLKMEEVVESILEPDDDILDREKRRKLCRKILDSQEEKLKDVADSLTAILNVFNAIHFDE